MADLKQSGLIREMEDVISFTLRTNYIETIQVKLFYVKTIITIVLG